jgi:hypothetical protein
MSAPMFEQLKKKRYLNWFNTEKVKQTGILPVVQSIEGWWRCLFGSVQYRLEPGEVCYLEKPGNTA